ncbi:MAG TPA: fimbria/pilus outer membrane usher protein [Thermoanaerobaculia bacterium]
MNGGAAGEKLVALSGDDVAMRRGDLEQLGLGGTMWNRLVTFGRLVHVPAPIEGEDAVSLKSLSPLLTYVLNQENLTLDLTVKPELLQPTVVEGRTARPTDIEYARDHTGFFNYSVSSPSMRSVTLFGEAGATIGSGLLYTGFSRGVGGHLVRGLTNYTYDDLKRLRRFTGGDAVVATESLGGSALITGVTVSRNFGLDPYFLRFPALNLAGTALTPSQVDVYVNGILVGRHDVPPGPFQLRDVPVAAGAGTTQIVVRDAFGRQTTASTNYYYATNLLNRGLSEYLYSAGVIRQDLGVRSFSTGDPAAVAFHRIGVSDALTLGGRAEASRQLFSGGPIVDFRTPIGEWRVAGSMSADHGRNGSAGELGYRFISRRYGFGASLRRLSDAYSTISMHPADDRPLLDATVFGSLSGRIGSLTAQWQKLDMRDADDSSRTTLGVSVPVGSRVAMLASASAVNENGRHHNEYFAGASLNFGNATTGSISFENRGDGHYDTIADIERALPVGTGFGYRLQTQVADTGDRTDVGLFSYQTRFGRYEIGEAASGSDRRPTLTASGGVVFAGRSLQFALPIQESYALVEVPGVSDVRVYASNQLVGRTDSRGFLLVPNLLAYYGNPLHIEDKDVPMTYEVAGVEKTVAPPYRGGAVVVFPVKQHRSIAGKLAISRGAQRVMPSLGTLTVKSGGTTLDSPIGRNGEFYLEDLPAGTYNALIEWADGQCSFNLSIPGGQGDIVNLGDVVCSQH